MIERKMCNPTNLAKQEFGSWWFTTTGEIWVQTSPDKEKPLWVLLGDLFMAHVNNHIEIPYEELETVLKGMDLTSLAKE